MPGTQGVRPSVLGTFLAGGAGRAAVVVRWEVIGRAAVPVRARTLRAGGRTPCVPYRDRSAVLVLGRGGLGPALGWSCRAALWLMGGELRGLGGTV